MTYSLLTENDETWRNYLEPVYHEVPLSALTDRTLRVLCTYLDMEIRSLDNDLPANYNGIVFLIRLHFGIAESIRRLPLPTASVIREWQKGQFAKVNPTIGNLVRAFVRLNRLDVASDCRNIITKDADEYRLRQEELPITPYSAVPTEMLAAEDTPGRPKYYDAFICWSESEADSSFVKDMVDKLENQPYNQQLYIPDRDGLFGVFKHETDARVMDERCKHVIVIFSPEYDKCENISFQTSVAIFLSSKDRNRHVVPILINGFQKCRVPDVVKMRTVCEFYNEPDEAKWRQLAQSICRFNFFV